MRQEALDIVMALEAPRDEAEMRKVADTFKGVPLLANIVEDGKTLLSRRSSPSPPACKASMPRSSKARACLKPSPASPFSATMNSSA